MTEETFTEPPQIAHAPEQPVDNIPTKNPPFVTSRILIIIGIFLAIISLVFTGVFMFFPKTEKQNLQLLTTTSSPAPITTLVPIPEESSLETPELFSGFNWEKTPVTIPLESPILYVDYEPLDINLSGKEWLYTDFGGSENAYRSFNDYYWRETSRFGWSNSLKHNNKKIQVISADGPTGGILGYIKVVGDKARIIVLEKNTKFKGYNIYEKVEFRVFVSDIFSTAELEK